MQRWDLPGGPRAFLLRTDGNPDTKESDMQDVPDRYEGRAVALIYRPWEEDRTGRGYHWQTEDGREEDPTRYGTPEEAIRALNGSNLRFQERRSE